jgi:hypothetical protein
MYMFDQVPGADLVSIHTFDEKHTAIALSDNNAVNASAGVWLGLKAVAGV